MTTQDKVNVMMAHIQGKKIQYCAVNGLETKWYDIEYPAWNWWDCQYRVKPEPKLVPWDLVPDHIGTVVRLKAPKIGEATSVYTITGIAHNCFHIPGYGAVEPAYLLNNLVQLDGSPCGTVLEDS